MAYQICYTAKKSKRKGVGKGIVPLLVIVAALITRLLFSEELAGISEFLLTEQAVAAFAEEGLTDKLLECLLYRST